MALLAYSIALACVLTCCVLNLSDVMSESDRDALQGIFETSRNCDITESCTETDTGFSNPQSRRVALGLLAVAPVLLIRTFASSASEAFWMALPPIVFFGTCILHVIPRRADRQQQFARRLQHGVGLPIHRSSLLRHRNEAQPTGLGIVVSNNMDDLVDTNGPSEMNELKSCHSISPTVCSRTSSKQSVWKCSS